MEMDDARSAHGSTIAWTRGVLRLDGGISMMMDSINSGAVWIAPSIVQNASMRCFLLMS